MTTYNYENFSSGDYDFNAVDGPDVGDRAPDFELITSEGVRKHLLDFDSDFLVLEMGSITCPLFQGRRLGMRTIEAEFDQASTAVLYVREAHPGHDMPAHKGFADKQACAHKLKTAEGEQRLIYVDDFDGAAHRAYGGMPNAVFIINRNHCVVYRSQWNNPQATKKALQSLIKGHAVRGEGYFLPVWPLTVYRTLGNAGKGSAKDFFRSLPSLIWNNLIKRNIRMLFRRKYSGSSSIKC